MSYERHNPYAGVAPCCDNCHRALLTAGYPAGRLLFCSPMCRDTSEDLRKYETTNDASLRLPKHIRCRLCDRPIATVTKAVPAANYYCSKDCEVRFLGIDLGSAAQCGIANCHVCSGAMRERNGGGDK